MGSRGDIHKNPWSLSSPKLELFENHSSLGVMAKNSNKGGKGGKGKEGVSKVGWREGELGRCGGSAEEVHTKTPGLN